MSQKLCEFEIYKKIQKIDKKHQLLPELPVIISLGSQSTGKSSVLDKIIGLDILPKGNILTTRCPLMINMRQQAGNEYAVINGTRIGFEGAKELIFKEVNNVCGSKKMVIDRPIYIDVYLNNTIQISLVDLPGLTKIPIGDQPADIDSQIEAMALKYISLENAIILAIIPANNDIANSDALKLTRKVDPLGLRTIGVLTKIDLMDKSTDCCSILENKFSSLEHGYIGVINRSESELQNKISIECQNKQEYMYFVEHEVYKKFCPKIGINHLKKVLDELFKKKIEEEVPKIKKKINKRIDELNVLKFKYSKKYLDKSDVIEDVYKIVDCTLKGISKEDGLFTYKSKAFVLKDIYLKLKEIKNLPCYKLPKNVEDYLIPDGSPFFPKKTFLKLFSERINEFKECFLRSIKSIEELIIDEYKHVSFDSSTDLWDRIVSDLSVFVSEAIKELTNHVKISIEVQKSFVNFNSTNFDSAEIISKAFQESIKPEKKDNTSILMDFLWIKSKVSKSSDFKLKKRSFELEILEVFLTKYIEITENNLHDAIIKSTHHFLFNPMKNVLKTHLFDKIMKYENKFFEMDYGKTIDLVGIDNELKDCKAISAIFNHKNIDQNVFSKDI